MKSACVYCRSIITKAGNYTFLCSSCGGQGKLQREERQIFLDDFIERASIAR